MKTTASPAAKYLERALGHIEGLRRDVPALIELGQRMAAPLLEGGNLFTPRVGPYWPSEFNGRAGGLMGLQSPDYVPRSRRDVALIAVPDPRHWHAADDETFRSLLAGPATIFAIGRADELPASAAERISGFTGGAPADAGMYATDKIKPLATLRPFEQLVRGWLAAGEMVAACTRGGRMPILWMSVWLEGALVRNAAFFQHHNKLEPWSVPLFHPEQYVPPLEAGYVCGAFLDELTKIHAILSRQTESLATAGAWIAEAIRNGRKPSMVAVGHSYPMILQLKDPSDCPLAWCRSISDLRRAHPAELSAGDVAIHFGYSPVNLSHVNAILDRGIRFIYSSPYGRPKGLNDHPNLIWLDLPWRPADATVDVPGYSVRLLPMSSSVHTIAYNALLCELAVKMGWID